MIDRLPKLIRRKLEETSTDSEGDLPKEDRSKNPVLRLWHVGHEDGSETMMLAAIVDKVLAGLAREYSGRPERLGALKRLKVDIVATDLMNKIKREGRRVWFAVHNQTATQKGRYLVEEMGSDHVRAAAREVTALERQARSRLASGTERAAQLSRLRDAGSLGMALQRLLRLDHHMYLHQNVPSHPVQLIPGYRLWTKHWRINDHENGGVINPQAHRRQIHFRLADVTRPPPGEIQPGQVDLVLCTNVLPYFGLYARNNTEHGGGGTDLAAAMRHLSGALQPRGVLVVAKQDVQRCRSTEQALRQHLTRRQVLLTTPSGLAELQE